MNIFTGIYSYTYTVQAKLSTDCFCGRLSWYFLFGIWSSMLSNRSIQSGNY